MVACVVVNWNGWQDTLACLQSLTRQVASDELQVIVVDNGSTNDSVARLNQFIAQTAAGAIRFRLIQHPHNVGFPSGANIGIREALAMGAEFVWLLNNDTECPRDTLAKLMATARTHPGAGIIGSVLYYHDDPSKVQAWSGGRINRWLGTSTHFYSPVPQGRSTYTTFASALVRSDVFREIGLLYEGFFMYYDDSDLCLRMEKTPWTIAVAADTAILHKEGASTTGTRNPFMEKTIATSGLRFLKQHSPVPLFSQSLFVLLKLANRVVRGQFQAAGAILQGVKEYRAHASASR